MWRSSPFLYSRDYTQPSKKYKLDSFYEISNLERMLPSMYEQIHIGTEKIDYMTYSVDMAEYAGLMAGLQAKLLESADSEL